MVKRCGVCGKKMDRFYGYFCKECLKEHNKETRELKKKYRKNGLCQDCGKPQALGHIRCKDCLDKERKSVRESIDGFDSKDLRLDLLKLKKELENENNRQENTEQV